MGGKRSKRAERCSGCRMLLQLCLCGDVPRVPTRARFILVRHRLEQWKTTNTGRLVDAALENCQMCEYGTRTEPPSPEPDWGAPETRYLFYPRKTGPAPVAPSALLSLPEPATIVVLDGTWSQTRKMARTLPEVQDIACVALPVNAEPRLSLREETYEGGMATLDAVSWLIEALEGPEVARPLNELYRTFVERVLASRGTPVAPLPGVARE